MTMRGPNITMWITKVQIERLICTVRMCVSSNIVIVASVHRHTGIPQFHIETTHLHLIYTLMMLIHTGAIAA